MHDIVGIAAPSDLGGTFYVSGDLYCCFKHFAKETTVKLQSTHAARVRRLINSSEKWLFAAESVVGLGASVAG